MTKGMGKDLLKKVAQKLLASGKGILAADERTETITKRFKAVGLESTKEIRRKYRQMLFTTPDFEKYISGVILFDETIYQSDDSGKKFVGILVEKNIVPGIKVDLGTNMMLGSDGEKNTNGLEGLGDRLKEYKKLGAEFTKWRAVYKIGDNLPSEKNIEQNAKGLAEFAKLSQENDLLPIVEPEVLMAGDHSIDQCARVTEKVLKVVFEKLLQEGIDLHGILLKTNMVLPGKDGKSNARPKEIAKTTIVVMKKSVPEAVPGIVFLSGGQKEKQAAENLNEINKIKGLPWTVSFSYGRALQSSAMREFSQKNIEKAQEKFLERAKQNSLACQGKL